MSERVVELQNMAALNQAIETSSERPVFLYKHSTVCPVSARAAEQVHAFADSETTDPAPLIGRILVIENRDVSNEVEGRLQVRHESPQLLLLRDGEVIWHASHFSITEERIKTAWET